MYLEEKKKRGESETIDEVGKILLDAADYIGLHGWCQGTVENAFRQVCAMGAINRASYLRCSVSCGATTTAQRKLAKYLECFVSSDNANDIADWNDAPGRTKEEVMAALRGAARAS
jgi:hypothetical protein